MNPERTLSKNVVCLATKILQIVAPHGHLKHLELMYGDIEVCEQEEWQEALTQICSKLTFLHLGSITALIILQSRLISNLKIGEKSLRDVGAVSKQRTILIVVVTRDKKH
jgi:hypothetical protein